jgi:hypothetical protein
MSIFKATFSPTVIEQLTARQKAMTNRTAKNLQYLNSRNAWIRMSSSVDIIQIGSNGNEEGNKDLAKKYILQGGILYDNKLRAGIGDFTKAYSNTASDGTPYRLGIRPMPGITNIEVRSKSAYGSLREAIVSFQCWDIKQLEDLELLYMRPGYTVLLEWGWSPYLNGKGEYNTNVEFYDIINTIKSKEEIWREIYAKTTNTGEYLDDNGETKSISHYDGNYDAMFGFVKNYSWSARPDGGYDCQTTIISMGEIVESLKVNYTPTVNINQSIGLLRDQVADTTLYDSIFSGGVLSSYYQKNILAGLWAEIYNLVANGNIQFILDSPLNGRTFKHKFESTKDSTNTSNTNNRIDKGGVQCYITLEALVDIINSKVIPIDNLSNRPLMTLSLKDRDGGDLQCVAHPMQVSTDITSCLINSPLWSGGTIIESIQTTAQDPVLAPQLETANRIASTILDAAKGITTDEQRILNAIRQINNITIFQLVNQKITDDKTYKDLEDLFSKAFSIRDLNSYVIPIKNHLKTFNVILEYPSTPPWKITLTYNGEPIQPTSAASQFEALSQDAPQTLASVEYLKELNNFYFPGNDPYPELGYIKNIYVNLNFLYQLSLDLGLETQDRKEKNEINLYDYIKRIMSTIQAALGNVSTFDLHVDPISNNVARIIDVNYTGDKGKSVYENLFELQVHNLNSIVRNYSLQSQIFPEQSTIIAIGSQAEGGQLGVQNNTMIDFNRKIRDRIVPEKIAPVRSLSDRKDGSELIGPLYQVIQYFKKLNEAVDPNAGDAGSGFTEAKNALRDLIVYFQTITTSPGKNRSLIPIKFSFEMDGIGGLVIGHMFRLPKDILPKGYKGEGVGTELGQVVTSIGHTLSNNDWITKIDALNIVLVDNNNPNLKPFSEIKFSELLAEAATAAANPAPPPSTFTGRTGGATKEFYGRLRKNGEVEDLLVSMKPDLVTRHNNPVVNLSDGGRVRLQSAPMQNLEKLLTDAYNAGVYLKVNSAYRNYSDQTRIKEDVGADAATPGTSNHGFGLAVDLADRKGTKINPITTKKEWKWIQENKSKYGFENLNSTNESHHYNYDVGQLSSTPPTPLPFSLTNYPTQSPQTLPRLF